MRRREFIAGLGSAAAWPVAARAQQSGVPVVGFLLSSTSEVVGEFSAGLTAGLAQSGYVDGRNVAVEYRTAEDHFERLPALANDLVRRRVAVIFTVSVQPALAAKAATQAAPIVFMIGADPVQNGSLARPGGNITGVTLFTGEVLKKRLALLLELVPAATTMAFLANPANPGPTEARSKELADAASHLGVRTLILTAANPSEIELAFATLAEQRAGALVVNADPFFTAQRAQIVALAARYRVPASYWQDEFVEAGGLMSYGASRGEGLRLAGAYVGRILNGEKRLCFVVVADPVGQGFVASVPHPGGNLTGFSYFEFSLGSKWLGLLKEVTPGVGRVAVMFNPNTAPQYKFFMPVIEAAAQSICSANFDRRQATSIASSMVRSLMLYPANFAIFLAQASEIASELCSHPFRTVAQKSDRTYVMAKGRMVWDGATSELPTTCGCNTLAFSGASSRWPSALPRRPP